MKALDTNVLVRYLVEDDPAQTRRAEGVIEEARASGERLFLSLLVVCETSWVLSRRYRQGRVTIADIIEELLQADMFLIEHADILHASVSRLRSGKAGLSDYVIGTIAQQSGCSRTVTFDRKLQGSPGFEIL